MLTTCGGYIIQHYTTKRPVLNDERGHTSSYITAAEAVILSESIHLDKVLSAPQSIKVALMQHFK